MYSVFNNTLISNGKRAAEVEIIWDQIYSNWDTVTFFLYQKGQKGGRVGNVTIMMYSPPPPSTVHSLRISIFLTATAPFHI